MHTFGHIRYKHYRVDFITAFVMLTAVLSQLTHCIIRLSFAFLFTAILKLKSLRPAVKIVNQKWRLVLLYERDYIAENKTAFRGKKCGLYKLKTKEFIGVITQEVYELYPQRPWQKKNGHFYTPKTTNRDTVNTVYDHRYVSIQCDRAFRKRVIAIKTVQHEIMSLYYFV